MIQRVLQYRHKQKQQQQAVHVATSNEIPTKPHRMDDDDTTNSPTVTSHPSKDDAQFIQQTKAQITLHTKRKKVLQTCLSQLNDFLSLSTTNTQKKYQSIAKILKDMQGHFPKDDTLDIDTLVQSLVQSAQQTEELVRNKKLELEQGVLGLKQEMQRDLDQQLAQIESKAEEENRVHVQQYHQVEQVLSSLEEEWKVQDDQMELERQRQVEALGDIKEGVKEEEEDLEEGEEVEEEGELKKKNTDVEVDLKRDEIQVREKFLYIWSCSGYVNHSLVISFLA